MKLQELNRKDLITGIDPRTRRYSKKVKGIRYEGITTDYTVVMKVPSVTAYPSTEYTVRIKLAEFPSLDNEDDLSIEDKVRLSIDGDLLTSCTCPAYKFYGYKYIMTQLSSNESDPEERFPIIRNPNLEGTICKHCMVALRGFGKWWKKIASDIARSNYINGEV